MTFEIITDQYSNKILDFIHTYNQHHSNNIGYCALDKEQLKIDLEELFSQKCNRIVCCYINNDLVGLVAFDVDLEKNNAEVWGPFVANQYKDMYNVIANGMIEKSKLHNQYITELRFLPNKKNVDVTNYLGEIGGIFKGFYFTYIIESSDYDSLSAVPSSVYLIQPNQYNEFITLHDIIFPNTYYTGKEIIEKLDSNNKIYVSVSDDKIVGYIYSELDPETKCGSIEFLGVAENNRNLGYGASLLRKSLYDLFYNQNANYVELCVSSQNNTARELYQKVGFNITKEYMYYILKV